MVVRDRDVLETESAIKVFEKALGWVKTVGYALGLVLAVVAGLGVWKASDWWSSVNAAKQAVIETSSKAQNQISLAAAGTEKTAKELSSNLERATGVATKNMAQQAVTLQRQVSQSRSQMEAASKLGPEMAAMQQQLAQATTDIRAQQKALSSSEDFVKGVFSSHITDFFSLEDPPVGPRYATIAPPKGGNRSIVLLLLSSAPIAQTLQLQYRVFSQPANSYSSVHNLVIFAWGEALENLKNQQLSASYFPDKSDKEIIHNLSQRDGRVFADGEPLPKFNQPDPDFKGNRWMTTDGKSIVLR